MLGTCPHGMGASISSVSKALVIGLVSISIVMSLALPRTHITRAAKPAAVLQIVWITPPVCQSPPLLGPAAVAAAVAEYTFVSLATQLVHQQLVSQYCPVRCCGEQGQSSSTTCRYSSSSTWRYSAQYARAMSYPAVSHLWGGRPRPNEKIFGSNTTVLSHAVTESASQGPHHCRQH